jgi:dTDP-4-amino-4,6-dideoxygalactose transaminase
MNAVADPNPIALTDLGALHGPLRAALTAAAERVLGSSRFILGEEVAGFERALAVATGVGHAVGLSSGSDALLALLMAAGVGPGDEVVTTPFSFFATGEAIVRLGARPVFADVEASTLNLDPEAAASRIGPRTKAALVVHLYGRVARTAPLRVACAAAGIPLFEDAAQAIGATADGRGPGTIGAAAALSFFPSKNLGGFGDGGAILTDDAGLAEAIRALRSHGARGRNRHEAIGGNFRLDELQAALLAVKLPSLPAWTARRRTLAGRYLEDCADLPIGLPPPDPGCAWNQFVIRVPGGRRDAFAATLRAAGIETAVYYPTPLHLQPALASFGGRAGDLPLAERAATEVLALPIHPTMTDNDVSRVCRAVRAACSGAA